MDIVYSHLLHNDGLIQYFSRVSSSFLSRKCTNGKITKTRLEMGNCTEEGTPTPSRLLALLDLKLIFRLLEAFGIFKNYYANQEALVGDVCVKFGFLCFLAIPSYSHGRVDFHNAFDHHYPSVGIYYGHPGTVNHSIHRFAALICTGSERLYNACMVKDSHSTMQGVVTWWLRLATLD